MNRFNRSFRTLLISGGTLGLLMSVGCGSKDKPAETAPTEVVVAVEADAEATPTPAPTPAARPEMVEAYSADDLESFKREAETAITSENMDAEAKALMATLEGELKALNIEMPAPRPAAPAAPKAVTP